MEHFIWTEAVGCGEILPPCLESFLAHHEEKIHIFGYPEDLAKLPKSNQIVPMPIMDNVTDGKGADVLGFGSELKQAYKNGHEGTALLWAKIISYRKEPFLIHLDSDTIFLSDVTSPILKRLSEGYGIVGTRRPYQDQVKTGMVKGLRKLQFYFYRDSINTHAFGFNKLVIREKDYKRIQESILGRYQSRIKQRLFPVIDFFDSITFQIARKSKVYYLDSHNQHKSGKHNRYGEFESSMISFAAVGSGCHFFKNPQTNTSDDYRKFALASFSLYSKYLLDFETGIMPLETSYLVKLLEKLDRTTWTLR